MKMGFRPCGLLLVAAVSSLAGCTRNLDMEKVKASIGDGIKTQVGATTKSVGCPERREIKAQDSFECTAQLDAGSVPVTVTQKDADGNITWELKQSILNVANLEKIVVEGLKEQAGADATVDCGPRFRPSKPNDTFECGAKSGSHLAKVKVTVKDAQGNVSWAIETAPGEGE